MYWHNNDCLELVIVEQNLQASALKTLCSTLFHKPSTKVKALIYYVMPQMTKQECL